MSKLKKGDIIIPRDPSKSKEFLKKCGIPPDPLQGTLQDFIGKRCVVDYSAPDGTARIVNKEGLSIWWTKRHLTLTLKKKSKKVH